MNEFVIVSTVGMRNIKANTAARTVSAPREK